MNITRKAHIVKDSVEVFTTNLDQMNYTRPQLPSVSKSPPPSTKNKKNKIFHCGQKCNFSTNSKNELERHVKSKVHLTNISPENTERDSRTYDISTKDNNCRNYSIPVHDSSTVRKGKRTIIKREYDDILYTSNK
jgi:hypothetical protein